MQRQTKKKIKTLVFSRTMNTAIAKTSARKGHFGEFHGFNAAEDKYKHEVEEAMKKIR